MPKTALTKEHQAVQKGYSERASPVQNQLFPLSFKGEGDTGGEVFRQPEYPEDCLFGTPLEEQLPL
jgi:hypothetical protein